MSDFEFTAAQPISSESDTMFMRHLDAIRAQIVDLNGTLEGSEDQATILAQVAYLATLAANLHPRWTFTTSAPGYLPESQPEVYDTWIDAHGAMRDYVQQAWDDDQEAEREDTSQPENGDSQADATWLEIDTALGTATQGQPFGAYNGGCSLFLSIDPVQRGLQFIDPLDDLNYDQ